MTIRKILPRRALRDADNHDGSYPTVSRTGDRRTGKLGITFDDTNTPIYVSGSGTTVSFPTMLPTGDRNLASDLQSGMTGRGRVTRGVIDRWLMTHEQNGSFVPFKEVGLHEQDIDKESQTYLTGTSVSDVGMGFRSPVGSKTLLHIELPIRQETNLNPLTASVYYYSSIGSFEEVAPEEKKDPNPFNDVGWKDVHAVQTDVKMFDPLGNYAASGSWMQRAFDGSSNLEGSDEDVTALSAAYFNHNFTNFGPRILSEDSGGALQNRKFAATMSQSVPASDFLTHPFVIERAIVDIPFKAGAGWLNDRTRMSLVVSQSLDVAMEMGGPGITFAILNQISETHRELIASGTIFPVGDSQMSVDVATELFPGSEDRWMFRTVSGHPAFGVRPTVLVHGNGSAFTGTLRLTIEPRISNGIVYSDIFPIDSFSDYTPSNAPLLSDILQRNFAQGYVSFINPFGRGGNGEASARSIFGREFATPTTTFIPPIQNTLGLRVNASGLNITGSSIDIYAKNAQGNRISPYLLFPTDKLVFAISKYRAAPTLTQFYTPGQFPLTSSHDVGIATGNMRVTLVGSLLRNGLEFHDTLNTPLTTDSAHEALGATVTDQFVSEARSIYFGSYTDVMISGSVGVDRGVFGNKSTFESAISKNPMYSQRWKLTSQLAGSNLFAQCISANERYWDSMLPGIDELTEREGKSLFVDNDTLPNIAALWIDVSPEPYTGIPSNTYNSEFSKNFPFAPMYGGLKRRLEVTKRVQASVAFVRDPNNEGSYKKHLTSCDGLQIVHVIKEPESDTQVLKYLVDWRDGVFAPNTDAEPLLSLAHHEDNIKMIYGFGDMNTFDGTGSFGTVNSPKTYWQHIEGRLFNGRFVNADIGVEIRGWKYGIMNGFPTFSRAHFRRDHFGQFRDMLEQRLYGTFYETIGYKSDGSTGGIVGKLQGPVTVRFVDNTGATVDPANTLSCNLSNEATSSLPFFDGEMRNRPEIDYSTIGSSVVTI